MTQPSYTYAQVKADPSLVANVSLWGIDGEERLTDEDIDDRIDRIVDDMHPDLPSGEVEIIGFAKTRVDAGSLADDVLYRTLSCLDEEYGDPDGDETDRTPAMKEAAAVFVAAILAEYTTWTCESVIHVTVDLAKWAAQHAGLSDKV
mgnify:CR=1 FL=1